MRGETMSRISLVVTVLCALLLNGCAGAPARFEVALIGDQQYGAESEKEFPALMADIDRSGVAFVVHVGDFKAGAAPCDDEVFLSRKAQFDASRHPFILTPGDNDWTDCHLSKTRPYEPVGRLARLREIFYPDDQSLGRRKLAVQRQGGSYAKYRENARWSQGGVLFATVHIVGSNNNFGRAPEQDAEYRERMAANLAWLKDVFAAAKREGARAVAIFTQANPRFEFVFPKGRASSLRLSPPDPGSGFADLWPAIETEVVAYGKPVMLLHGDTHYFRVDKPLFRTGTETVAANRGRQVDNFTRVEVHGFPEAHWVRLIVDPDDPAVFSVREALVEENRFKKQ
jgi:hypothetical protein